MKIDSLNSLKNYLAIDLRNQILKIFGIILRQAAILFRYLNLNKELVMVGKIKSKLSIVSTLEMIGSMKISRSSREHKLETINMHTMKLKASKLKSEKL